MSQNNKLMTDPWVRISIEAFLPDPDTDGLIYSSRRVITPEWIKDDRYGGYATYYFQEMYEEMVRAVKGKL
jgi:hypothetical protein